MFTSTVHKINADVYFLPVWAYIGLLMHVLVVALRHSSDHLRLILPVDYNKIDVYNTGQRKEHSTFPNCTASTVVSLRQTIAN